MDVIYGKCDRLCIAEKGYRLTNEILWKGKKNRACVVIKSLENPNIKLVAKIVDAHTARLTVKTHQLLCDCKHVLDIYDMACVPYELLPRGISWSIGEYTALIYKKYIGDLNYFKSNGQYLPIVHQIVNAVNEIHNLGLAHQDIKTENVLYKLKRGVYKIKMIDIESVSDNESCIKISSWPYYPPEWMKTWTNDYSYIESTSIHCAQKADAWALGCLIYTFISSKYLYYLDNTDPAWCMHEVEKKYSTGYAQRMIDKVYTTDTDLIFLKQVASQLLNYLPNKRPSMKRVLRMFEEFRYQNVEM